MLLAVESCSAGSSSASAESEASCALGSQPCSRAASSLSSAAPVSRKVVLVKRRTPRMSTRVQGCIPGSTLLAVSAGMHAASTAAPSLSTSMLPSAAVARAPDASVRLLNLNLCDLRPRRDIYLLGTGPFANTRCFAYAQRVRLQAVPLHLCIRTKQITIAHARYCQSELSIDTTVPTLQKRDHNDAAETENDDGQTEPGKCQKW